MAKFDSKSFNPQAFGKYIKTVPQLKKNELLRAGVLRASSEIRNTFSSQSGSAYAVLPMYGLLDGDAQNYDGVSDFVPAVTNSFERGVVVVGRMRAWTEKDFSDDITGAGFMDNVAAQVSDYFDGVDQNTMLAVLEGVFNMTGGANGDFVDAHTLDITEEGNGCVGATTLNDAVLKACGDNKGRFSVVVMHSKVATNLENLNLIDYTSNTDESGIQRDLTLGTWNGRLVLVDDSMPVNDGKYTTYILGSGAFDYEDIGAKVPFEMNRDPKTNGGIDTLYVRTRKCFAPMGLSYIKAQQATLSPTDAELKLGANWELANDGAKTKTYIDHKAIPIARIVSLG